MKSRSDAGDISVYVHIPFCVRKCLYCDFNSFAASEEVRGRYVSALLQEIDESGSIMAGRDIVSVYIGGGTPSLLDEAAIASILDSISRASDISGAAEITVEMNPGTVTPDKIRGYVRAGVNRASIGLQSASDKELRALGRIHVMEDFLRSYDIVKEAGIGNVNVDIMTGIPCQTEASLIKTIDSVTALYPEHISAYSLIIEEGTPFYDMGEDRLCLPGEEETYRLYKLTQEYLSDKGYDRYEISNYARRSGARDYRCRHNLRYWERREYAGFGISAASFVGGRRYTNTSDISSYLEAPGAEHAEDRSIDEKSGMEEFMYLGLREIRGVSEEDFLNAFGRNIWDIYGEVIERHTGQGLMSCENGRIALSDRGIDVSNMVLSEYLLHSS